MTDLPINQIVCGDAIETLKGLPACSVQCVITSPPYWGLRDYGIEPRQWPSVTFTPVAGLPEMTIQGCEPDCEHKWGHTLPGIRRDNQHVDQAPGNKGGGTKHSRKNQSSTSQGQYCQKCGGWRGVHGLEPDPWSYVAHAVLIFREVRRVLRDDGVLWLNLGSTYNGAKTGNTEIHKNPRAVTNMFRKPLDVSFKPKDLIDIPHIVAHALQADGWWLRQALPWVKQNPMPESTTDRPTNALEYVFLLTKKARCYFDMEAVRVAAICAGDNEKRVNAGRQEQQMDPIHFRTRPYGRTCGYPSSRAYRNTDLWYQSVEKPFGMVGADGELVGFDVLPQGFKGWAETVLWRRVHVGDEVSGDMRRIESQDCSVHGSSDQPCGEREDDAQIRTAHIGGDPLQSPPLSPVSNSMCPDLSPSQNNKDCSAPTYSQTATSHSKRTHKTGPESSTNSSYKPCDKTPSHIADKSVLPASSDSAGRKRVNNTWPDEVANHVWTQTPYHIVNNSSLPLSPNCTCGLYMKVTTKSSHFATFGTEFVRPLLKAGTSAKGACPKCGAPWARVVERQDKRHWTERNDFSPKQLANKSIGNRNDGVSHCASPYSRTIGWRPTCKCGCDKVVPCVVLDIFGGSGTVGYVAAQEKRDYVLIEVNPEYCDMGRKRLAQVEEMPLFEAAKEDKGLFDLEDVRP